MVVIDDKILKEFSTAGRCEYCQRWVKDRDPHHVTTRGAGRLDIRINLIALCATFSGGLNCHHLAHEGKIRKEDLIRLVAIREGITSDQILDKIYLLRRLPKETSREKVEEILRGGVNGQKTEDHVDR